MVAARGGGAERTQQLAENTWNQANGKNAASAGRKWHELASRESRTCPSAPESVLQISRVAVVRATSTEQRNSVGDEVGPCVIQVAHLADNKAQRETRSTRKRM